MRLVLARHGETTWNAVGRIQGKTDTPLSEKGMQQARDIGDMLSVEIPVKVFSSTLTRAYNTAQEIAKKHGLEVEKRHELDEINYGMFEGKTFDEIEKDQTLRELWEERRKGKYNFKPKGGESFREMNEKRIKPFVDNILEKYKNDCVIVVAHTGTNRLIAGNCLHLPPEKMVDVWQPNKVVYFIDCDEVKCYYSYKEIGAKKTVKGFLTVADMKSRDDLFK